MLGRERSMVSTQVAVEDATENQSNNIHLQYTMYEKAINLQTVNSIFFFILSSLCSEHVSTGSKRQNK